MLPDDTTQYNAKILKVSDSASGESYTIDASFGRTPQGQAKLLNELTTRLSVAQQFALGT